MMKDMSFDKDFKGLVYSRCDVALMSSKEYQEAEEVSELAQKEGDIDTYAEKIATELCIAEEVCYRQGYADAIRMLKNIGLVD